MVLLCHAGLRSLSGSELAVYMQLTEELRSDNLADLASSVRPEPSEYALPLLIS